MSRRADNRRAQRKEKHGKEKATSDKGSFSDTYASSPDVVDDPKDADYGPRTPGGRKAVTAGSANVEKGTPSRSERNAMTNQKTSTVPAKRRSSTTTRESVGKRPRQSNQLQENQEVDRAVSEPPSSGAP